MYKDSKNLKSPKELFEEIRLKSLEDLQQKKIKEEKNKKIVSPKQFFNENSKDIQEETSEPTEVKIDYELIEEDQYQQEVSVEEYTAIGNFKFNDCLFEIENIKEELLNIKDQVRLKETFDSSDLYANISDLKIKIQEVRSEIPIVPQPILYDDELNELRSIVEVLKINLDNSPEVKYYDQELSEILDTIDQVKYQL